MHPDEEYKLLPESPSDLSDNVSEQIQEGGFTALRHSRTLLRIVIFQSAVIVALFLGMLWIRWPLAAETRSQHHIYSPADEAATFEAKVFSPDFHSTNIYIRDPSPEVDQVWNDLYNDYGLSEIEVSQARLLPNKTLTIPGSNGKYIVALSVFHQLHCLNNLRKIMYPEYYIDPITGDMDGIPKDEVHDHLTHCVDTLRQGIMCASDISPIVWQWNEHKGHALAYMDVPHTCRNFGMIQDWAREHKLQHHFDFYVHAEEDII